MSDRCAATMLKSYAVFLLALAGLHVQAQTQPFLELRASDGSLVNGQFLTVIGSSGEFSLYKAVSATLVGGEPRVVNVRRYEVDVQPGTYNYFCWGQCYAPREAGQTAIWTGAAQDALLLEPGVTANNFSAYHMPSSLVGNSTYRYVWFDTGLPTDSAWCDIQFRAIDNVGVEELRPAATLGVFPNPSRGGDVQFSLELRNVDQALDLVVFNALGERVRTITVRPDQLNVRLGSDALSNGLYFASLVRGGTTLATQRFVVSGR
jgi:hypothetical protein